MVYFESILKVLLVGLILGAGLPALFATGMLAYSFGAGGEEADHVIHKPNPALKYLGIVLFLFVSFVIVVGRRVDHPGDDHSPLRGRPVPDAGEVSRR